MATRIIPGILFLLAGIWLLYWVGKRRFNRRGPGGLQQFSSYGRGLVVMVIEKVAKVLGWALCLMPGDKTILTRAGFTLKVTVWMGVDCGGLLWFLYVREVGIRTFFTHVYDLILTYLMKPNSVKDLGITQ